MRTTLVSILSLMLMLASQGHAARNKEKTIRIRNAAGVREIVSHHREAAVQSSSKARFAYLLLSRIPSASERKTILDCNVRILRTYRVDDDGVAIYHVQLQSSLGRAKRLLGSSLPSFFNLTPVLPEDKISAAIHAGHGFGKGELKADGSLFVSLAVHRSTDATWADSTVRSMADSILAAEFPYYTIKVSSVDIARQLAEMEEVKRVHQHDPTPAPVMVDARVFTRVDSAQAFDTANIGWPPHDTTTWSPNNRLTGEGVLIGIYDGGAADTSMLDFKEIVGLDTLLRDSAGLPWSITPHYNATHVSAIACGNGWMSAGSGKPGRYAMRGVAPKARLHSAFANNLGSQGDVNNHSWAHESSSYYSYQSKNVDEHLEGHLASTHIKVYAAGNNGVKKSHGLQQGFYSLTCSNAKNSINVGAVYTAQQRNGQPLRTSFSSMGPTRDGRIKPDVMAPGDSHSRPTRDAAHPVHVEIDSIAVLDSAGNLKVAWGFSSGDMGWDNVGNSGIANVGAANGVLSFDDTLLGSWIWSDSTNKIATPPECALHDSLYIRYRIVLPPHERDLDSLEFNFVWQVDNNAYHRGISKFTLGIQDTSVFSEYTGCLADFEGDWSAFYTTPAATEHLVKIRLDPWFAPGTGGILSCALSSQPFDYTRHPGTSQAAPHVTGIVALMLQEYKQKVLDHQYPPGNIHTDAFWNSTARALLIHTATDLVNETGYPAETRNPDTDTSIIYHAGPDFSTGWGLVNAAKATAYVDTTLFKQDSIAHQQTVTYKAVVTNPGDFRVTLAWDDEACMQTLEAQARDNKLINDLDMYVIGDKGRALHLPWVLDSLPQGRDIYGNLPDNGIDPISLDDIQPAYRGVDKVNNVEVVDIEESKLFAGDTLTIVIRGWRVPGGMTGYQHFSLVADAEVWKDTTLSGGEGLPIQWMYRVPVDLGPFAMPALSEDDSTLYFGAEDSTLYAINTADGSLKWQLPLDEVLSGSPAVSDSSIFIGAGNPSYNPSNGMIYRITDDGTHGSISFSDSLTSPCFTTPALDLINDIAIFGTSRSGIKAVAFDGDSILWETPAEEVHDIIRSGVISGNHYIVSDTFNVLNSYRTTDGALVDQMPLTDTTDSVNTETFRPVVSGGNIYVETRRSPYYPSVNHEFRSYTSAGTLRSSFSGEGWFSQEPGVTVHAGYIYTGFHSPNTVESDTFLIVDEATGERVWHYSHEGLKLHGAPALGDNGLIYLPTQNGMVIVLDHQNFTGDSGPSATHRYIPMPASWTRSGFISSDGVYYALCSDEGAGGNAYVVAIQTTAGGMVASFPCGNYDAQNTCFVPGDIHPYLSYQESVDIFGGTGEWDTTHSEYSLCGAAQTYGEGEAFACTYMVGDFDITARIISLDSTADSTAAGIMVRTALDDDTGASFCQVFATAGAKVGFAFRDDNGGSEDTLISGIEVDSLWFRLRRVDEKLVGYVSVDSSSWVSMGACAIDGNLYAGLSHRPFSNTSSGCAVFGDIDFNYVSNSAYAYEGFDYTSGQKLIDLQGGIGWGGPWENGWVGQDQYYWCEVDSAGSTYGDLAVSGGRAVGPSNEGLRSRMYRSMATSVGGAADEDVWFGFIISDNDSLESSSFDAYFGENQIFSLKVRKEGGRRYWYFEPYSGPDFAWSGTRYNWTAGEHFVIVRIDNEIGNANLAAWFNPVDASQLGDPDLEMFGNSTGALAVDNIRWRTIYNRTIVNNASLDEIRIGPSAESVFPCR